jgi:WD40 repeat protein
MADFCISPDGDQRHAQPLSFWALRPGSRLSILRLCGHTMEVNAVLRMGDSRVVSAADDAVVRVWDWRATSHTTLAGHEVRSFRTLSNGSRVSFRVPALVAMLELKLASIYSRAAKEVQSPLRHCIPTFSIICNI